MMLGKFEIKHSCDVAPLCLAQIFTDYTVAARQS